MTSLFAATAHHGCLDAVGEALEMQYEQAGIPAAATRALEAACDAALPALQVRTAEMHAARLTVPRICCCLCCIRLFC